MTNNILDSVLTSKECAEKYDMHHLTVNSRVRSYGTEGVDYRISANNKHDLIILKSFADKILRLAEANNIENKAKVKPSYRINVEGRDFEI